MASLLASRSLRTLRPFSTTLPATSIRRMASSPRPVIVCGRTAQIAQGVIANLKPEYEVSHLVLSKEAGASEIPAILRGESPASSTGEGLDTRNYAELPEAILLGAGYDDEGIEMMRAACKGAPNQLPWLRPDTTKPAPPLGPEYGKALVGRIKEVLKDLREKGELGKDGVVWY